jgi:hypothetical protein
MAISLRLTNITCPNPFTLGYSTSPYGTFTNVSYSGSTPTVIIAHSFEFDTQYFIKLTDSVTNRYIIENIYIHDSKAFPCYDTIDFDLSAQCVTTPEPTTTPTITPTKSVTPTPTPTITLTQTITPTLTITAEVQPTQTPTPTLTITLTPTSNCISCDGYVNNTFDVQEIDYQSCDGDILSNELIQPNAFICVVQNTGGGVDWENMSLQSPGCGLYCPDPPPPTSTPTSTPTMMAVNVTNLINGTTGTINQVLIPGLLDYQTPITPDGLMFDTLTGTTDAQTLSIAINNAEISRTYTVSVTAYGSIGSGISRSATASQFAINQTFTLTPTINLTGVISLNVTLDVNYP